MARWTSDFDCGFETNWWYCLKDTPFDVAALPSKKRYEINKGKKNFNVKIINPTDYVDEIYQIQKMAWLSYPKAYRPVMDEDKMRRGIANWKCYKVFAAFSIADDSLCAFACLQEHSDWVNFLMLKAKQESEKLAVNAAIVAGICEHYSDKLSSKFYICDGERNIVHQTAFQDYLVKYFGFRKAYCKLNVVYRPPVGLIVKWLFPIRNLLEKCGELRLCSSVCAVLKMEEFARKYR